MPPDSAFCVIPYAAQPTTRLCRIDFALSDQLGLVEGRARVDQQTMPGAFDESLGPKPRKGPGGGLCIYGLGRLRVCFDGVPVRFPTQKTQDLLCLLFLRAGERVRRDVIAELLWPMRSAGKARRSLSTALWRLRQVLASQAASPVPYILSDRDAIALNAAARYWFDVHAFEELASAGLSGPLPCSEHHRQALEKALELCSGDLFEGCYDDWCLADRERFRLLLLRVLKKLQCDYRLGRMFGRAIACGDRLLALDSLQEDVHRELMRCYVEAGQRPQALEQFRRCRAVLRQELEIEPMPETWELFRRIQSDQERIGRQGAWDNYQASLQTALTQFQRALGAMESAWRALQALATGLPEEGDSAQGETLRPEG